VGGYIGRCMGSCMSICIGSCIGGCVGSCVGSCMGSWREGCIGSCGCVKMTSFEDYNSDWKKFEKYIEKKIKDRCELNNKNWLKLRDYHFENFIVKVSNPYIFVFKMIYVNRMHRKIPCIYKLLYKYKKTYQETDGSLFRMKTRASSYKKYR